MLEEKMLEIRILIELLNAMKPDCLTTKVEYGDDVVYRDEDGSRVWKYKNIRIAKYDGHKMYIRSWMFSYTPSGDDCIQKCSEFDAVRYRLNNLITFF